MKVGFAKNLPKFPKRSAQAKISNFKLYIKLINSSTAETIEKTEMYYDPIWILGVDIKQITVL